MIWACSERLAKIPLEVKEASNVLQKPTKVFLEQIFQEFLQMKVLNVNENIKFIFNWM